MSNRETVVEMFTKQKKTPFDIHMVTGLSFKEIQHYVKESVVAKNRHKKQLALTKEAQVS